jgi:hypothetical protein
MIGKATTAFASALRRVDSIVSGFSLVPKYTSLAVWIRGDKWSFGESWWTKVPPLVIAIIGAVEMGILKTSGFQFPRLW